MGGASIIGIVNQKGGTGKTTSCVNLGVDLAREGKRVLLVDCDPQSSLTISLGHPQPDTLPATLADQMTAVLSDSPIEPGGILHHDEGVDLLPANISLAGMEVSLVNAMSRETTLKRVLANYSKDYDHILLDCSPSLGMLTINALAAADRIIVPVQAQYLSIKGVEQLLGTVARVKKNINHRLKIDGVLLTMVDSRTNNSKEITALLRETYGSRIRIFDAEIPRSVRAAEISAEGTSIFEHDPGGKVAQAYLANPCPENVPILEDLYNALRQQEEKEAQSLATALEIYVTGSLNVFNHRTNVDVNNRLVCYDIKELGKQLKKLGMLIVQDQVWGRVTENRAEGKSTRYYMDEFHLLLKEEQTATYSVEIWKRFRKWGGIPTGITQNVKDLLASQEIENIFENSDYIYMLNQAAGDREILAKKLGISPHQLSYVTQSGEGEGLLFYGNVILPFQDRFPKNTKLYSIMTTKPTEVHAS